MILALLTRIGVVAKRLSEMTGERISVSTELANDPLVLRIEGQPLDSVLARIAHVMHAQRRYSQRRKLDGFCIEPRLGWDLWQHDRHRDIFGRKGDFTRYAPDQRGDAGARGGSC
jgi:hypothetical protein